MQFAQLSGQDGLRGVEHAMASHKNLNYHLGTKEVNHSGYIPEFVNVTSADHHEVNELQNIPLKSGDVVTFDRGYYHFNQSIVLVSCNCWGSI